MSTLKRQEPVGAGLRRIACEHIEAGVRALTRQADAATPPAESLRHAQAVFGLIEPAMPRATARRAQGLFQTVRETLASIDQPVAMLDRLDRHFKKTPSDAALAGAVKAIRKRWTGRRGNDRVLNSRGGNFDPAVYRLIADMAELRGHAGEWPIDAIADDDPPAGLRRTYARARRLADAQGGDPSIAELADALTTLRDQLAVLTKACPAMLKAQRKLIDRALTPLHEHRDDVALDQLLCEAIDQPPGSALPDALATPERNDLLFGADLRAALAESPAAFSKRMNAYWSSWRATGS